MDTFLELLKIFILFSMVLGLAWLSTQLIGAKWGAPFRGRALRVLEQLPVARDRALLLVEVGGKIYLVGTGAQGMSLIDRIDDPDEVADLLAKVPQQQGPVGMAFGDMLERLRRGAAERGGGPGGGPDDSTSQEERRLADQIERLRRLGQK